MKKIFLVLFFLLFSTLVQAGYNTIIINPGTLLCRTVRSLDYINDNHIMNGYLRSGECLIIQQQFRAIVILDNGNRMFIEIIGLPYSLTGWLFK